MSSIENYDGLCGIISKWSESNKRIRCNYEFFHSGPCSFEKKKLCLTLFAGCGPRQLTPEEIQEQGFIDSVLNHNQSDK